MPSPSDRDDADETEDDPRRAAEHRAVVSLNDLLVGVLESLQDGQRLPLPSSVRSALDYLALEVAKLQGVTEWVAEDLVRLGPEPHGEDAE
ncbi:MAG: hypothetical protein M9894_09580 [Planctomycetes bacterium]|nr:hypothetical protein [Planctomycetota bacterium]